MGQLHCLTERPSMLDHLLVQLRDLHEQQDRARFRHRLQLAGQLMAYELSKHLAYTEESVKTPLGEASGKRLASSPVLAPILRSGLPYHQGFLEVFQEADSAFIAAHRVYTGDNTYDIAVESIASPSIQDRNLFILDPLVATGRSAHKAWEGLEDFGDPLSIWIVGILASDQAVEYLQRNLPNAKLMVLAVDSELTARSYIVPGMGDAGDLAFGKKGMPA